MILRMFACNCRQSCLAVLTAALAGWLLVQSTLAEEPAATGAVTAKGAASNLQPPQSVLFIGNSYTYTNDLPAMLKAMAEAKGQKLETDQVTPPGVTLQQQVEKGEALKKIQSRKWDVVILQDNSLRPVNEPAAMLEPAKQFCEAARKQGARVVFYLTWARQKTPETQPKINAAYFDLSGKLGAEVAPVGIAWQKALTAAPDQPLHVGDGSHPNPQGTYLAGCTFYGVLFGQSPVGLPAKLSKGNKTLIELPAARATQLQALAWEAVGEKQTQ